jgi:hypothetical protein
MDSGCRVALPKESPPPTSRSQGFDRLPGGANELAERFDEFSGRAVRAPHTAVYRVLIDSD